MADYWTRIRDQQKMYETVTAEEGPFIKVMNVGERIEVNRIEGQLSSIMSGGVLIRRIPTDEMLFLLDEHTHVPSNHLFRKGESKQCSYLWRQLTPVRAIPH